MSSSSSGSRTRRSTRSRISARASASNTPTRPPMTVLRTIFGDEGDVGTSAGCTTSALPVCRSASVWSAVSRFSRRLRRMIAPTSGRQLVDPVLNENGGLIDLRPVRVPAEGDELRSEDVRDSGSPPGAGVGRGDRDDVRVALRLHVDLAADVALTESQLPADQPVDGVQVDEPEVRRRLLVSVDRREEDVAVAENLLVESGITEENGDRRGVLLLLGQRQTQRRERDQDDAEHDEADAPPESLDDSVDVPPIRVLAGALARHLKTCRCSRNPRPPIRVYRIATPSICFPPSRELVAGFEPRCRSR